MAQMVHICTLRMQEPYDFIIGGELPSETCIKKDS